MSIEAELKEHYKAVSARLSPRPPAPPNPLPVVRMAPEAVIESIAFFGTKARAQAILEEICLKHDLPIKLVMSPFNGKKVCLAKAEACFRMRMEITVNHEPMSFPMIGRVMKIDHSTALYHVKTFERRNAK